MSSNSSVTIQVRAVAGRESVTEAIVEAVAEAEDVSPLELEPLAAVVDPDALNALFQGDGSDMSLEFDYRGFSVRVSDDGRVALD